MSSLTAKPYAYAIEINYPFAKAHNLLQKLAAHANIESVVDKGLPPSINESDPYSGWRRKGQTTMAYTGTQSQTGGVNTATQENLQTLPDDKPAGNAIKRTRPARRSSARLKAQALQESENQKTPRDQVGTRTFQDMVASINPAVVEPPKLDGPLTAPSQAAETVEAAENQGSRIDDANWYEAKTVEEFIPCARAHARTQLGLTPEDGSVDEDEASELFLNTLGAKFATEVRDYSLKRQQVFFTTFGIEDSDRATVLENGGRSRQIVTDALIVWEKNKLKLPKRVSYSEIENAMHAKNFELLGYWDNQPIQPKRLTPA